jgi:uncharacterized protein
MKKILFVCLLFLSAGLSLAQEFPPKPSPPRAVNDFAGVLSEGEEQTLERKLRNYNDTTSTGFVIVLLNSYGGNDPGQYTIELGNRWAIGQKGKNNGLLITIAVQDRKYSIATGYGLEGAIPDIITKRVGDQYFKPNFRNNDYYAGLDQATTYLAALPAGEFKGTPRRTQDDGGGGGFGLIIAVIIIVIILSSIFRGGRGNRRGYRGGRHVFPSVHHVRQRRLRRGWRAVASGAAVMEVALAASAAAPSAAAAPAVTGRGEGQ